MIELLSNLVWLLIAVAAIAAVPRRSSAISRRGSSAAPWIAIACVLAILLPLISVSDDLATSRETQREVAAVLSGIAIVFALTALARARRETRATYAESVLVKADPRSPPRR